MASQLNIAAFLPALKTMYADQKVIDLTYSDHPFYAMLAKKDNFFGDKYPLISTLSGVGGSSSSFARAKARKNATNRAKFDLVRRRHYTFASIDNETAEASENDKGAFLKALSAEIDSALKTETRHLAHKLVNGNGTGVLDTVAVVSGAGPYVVTLNNYSALRTMEIGQYVGFFAGAVIADTATAQLTDAAAPAKYGQITAIDRIGKKITVAMGAGVPVVADKVFFDGDVNEGSGLGLDLVGLDGWLPTANPSSTSFFGVDRTVDVTRLGGVRRSDLVGAPIEEALIELSSDVCIEGGNPDVSLVSHSKWKELEKAMGSKVQYMISNAFGSGKIGFQGIQVKTNKGVMNVISEPSLVDNRIYCLTMKTWALHSLKAPVRILDLDGNKMLRESDSDGNELRIGGYRQLGCEAVGHNGVALI